MILNKNNKKITFERLSNKKTKTLKHNKQHRFNKAYKSKNTAINKR